MAKGKNDHKKGNRTDSPRDISKMNAISSAFKFEIDEYKRYATARRENRVYRQVDIMPFIENVKQYINECDAKREPITIAGIILATGTNKDFISKAKHGEYDYLLEEYIALNNISDSDIVTNQDGIPCHVSEDGEVVCMLIQWSDAVQKSLLLVQAQLERNCYTNKGNPAGSIFGLKAQFKWREDDTAQHVVNQLVIADLDQAKKALDMLK